MSKTGIIYKLVSRDINIKEIYVGSTINFRTRKHTHKCSCNNENRKGYNINVYQFIRANGGWDSFDMLQVEEFKHDTKQELRARERHWIEQLKATLNIQIPTRTLAEWYQDNRENIAEWNKQYRQDNKEYIVECQKQYRQDNKAKIVETKKQHYQDNKEVIAEKQKQYRQSNKEKIAEKGKLKYTCECGSTFRISDKSQHKKSIKHMAWMATQ